MGNVSQKLPVAGFKWVENMSQFNKDFIEYYKEGSEVMMNDIFLKEKFNILKIHTTFTLKRMKIEKIERFVANLFDKKDYVILIRNLKRALNHGLVLTKVE